MKKYPNGFWPQSALKPIGNGEYLHEEAANAYLAMQRDAAKDGVRLSPTDGYRSFQAQVVLARLKGLYRNGGLAAVPGTSSHGDAEAVDEGEAGRAWMARNGRRYGWAGPIPREPWHFYYVGGYQAKKREKKRRPAQKKDWPVLRLGSRGEHVRIVQTKLGVKDTGYFGPVTRRYVISFQQRHGLTADGVVGKVTWKHLVEKTRGR